MDEITVIKQNPAGEEIWRYNGIVLKRGETFLVVEAFFDRDDLEFHGMCLCHGDRFVETYYFERWYNLFEIHNREDDRLKGWYCNISSPAIEGDGWLAYRDLALDLLVFPNGRQIVLDEDEFVVLALSPREQELALAALAELQAYFREKTGAAN
jgi:predicted RNA-binding protein associated with RNAse of E/G family